MTGATRTGTQPMATAMDGGLEEGRTSEVCKGRGDQTSFLGVVAHGNAGWARRPSARSAGPSLPNDAGSWLSLSQWCKLEILRIIGRLRVPVF